EPAGMVLRTAGLTIMLGTLSVFLLGRAATRSSPRPIRTRWGADYVQGTLILSGPMIDDQAVAKAVQLYPMLQVLSLEESRITDSALQYLTTLRRLEHLNLRGTGITDVGLEHLE